MEIFLHTVLSCTLSFNEKILGSGAQAFLPTFVAIPKPSSKHKICGSHIFEYWVVRKQGSLCTYKTSSQKVGDKRHFCISGIT